VGNVARNPEKPKERYVEDADAGAVAAIALRSVCMAMRLVYITLQRPADILALSPQSLTTKTVGGVAKRVLSVTQGKTGRTVNIELTDELEETLYMLSPDREPGKMKISESVTKLVKTFVHTSDGSRYSDDGMRAMLRRYCLKCGVSTFGLMDLRAKGATDMYLNGIPLERIQMLMGHKSVVTTEIYIKRLLALVRIAQPNRVKTGFA
jgi:integrase